MCQLTTSCQLEVHVCIWCIIAVCSMCCIESILIISLNWLSLNDKSCTRSCMLDCDLMVHSGIQDQRPPSRQKPPPEALHLFQPVHGSSSGGFAPSPVFRAAATSTARPSTSASIMQQASVPRFKPSGSAVLHTGHMTLEDLQKLSHAAVSNSQALNSHMSSASAITAALISSAEARAYLSSAETRSHARPSSARLRSAQIGSGQPGLMQTPSGHARPLSARPTSATNSR